MLQLPSFIVDLKLADLLTANVKYKNQNILKYESLLNIRQGDRHDS